MRRLVIALALVLGVAAVLYFSPTDEVGAVPPREIETYFYSDASMDTEVGWRFRGCSGPVIMEGSFSDHRTIYPGDPCGSGNTGYGCYACYGPDPSNPPATMQVTCPALYQAEYAGFPAC